MRKVRQIRTKGKMAALTTVPQPEAEGLASVDARVALIQALVPLGLEKVAEELVREVDRLAGPWYARAGGDPRLVRWGEQRGSVYLADQKLPVMVPRVRNRQTGQEVRLQTYARLQQPRGLDQGLVHRILGGLSTREYARCAEASLLEAQRAEHKRLLRSAGRKRQPRFCPYVFNHGGQRITTFTKAWRIACVAAGCPGRIPHDFHRTAVRNLVRAGVSETVAMHLTGHKTRSVFDRYDIVSGDDLRAAVGKLAARTGTVWGQSGDRARSAAGERRGITEESVEAPSGFEPEMEVLQTSALPLGYGAEARSPVVAGRHGQKTRGNDRAAAREKMERETGFEPATSTLARSHSTTELFPLDEF